MGIGGWIVIAVVVLLVVWLVFTYNRLVTARNRTQEAWSEIDVELKRRHDLRLQEAADVQAQLLVRVREVHRSGF